MSLAEKGSCSAMYLPRRAGAVERVAAVARFVRRSRPQVQCAMPAAACPDVEDASQVTTTPFDKAQPSCSPYCRFRSSESHLRCSLQRQCRSKGTASAAGQASPATARKCYSCARHHGKCVVYEQCSSTVVIGWASGCLEETRGGHM